MPLAPGIPAEGPAEEIAAMKLFATGLLASAALTLGLALHAQPGGASTAPVVLELFTSQGCSSCPPADALLARMAREDNTRLQRAYAARNRGGDGVYTPEVVVDGMAGVVGSNEGGIRAAVAAARRGGAGGGAGGEGRSGAGGAEFECPRRGR